MAHGHWTRTSMQWNIISTMILHIFGKYQRSRKWLFFGLWLFFSSHVLVHMLLWGDRIICKLSAGIPPVSIQQGGDIYKLWSSFKLFFWKVYSARKLLEPVYTKKQQKKVPDSLLVWGPLKILNGWSGGSLGLIYTQFGIIQFLQHTGIFWS